MLALKNFYFFQDETTTGTSEEFDNKKADTLTIQVTGTFTSAAMVFEGLSNGEYIGIAVINLNDLSVSNGGAISAKGIYTADITGCQKYRVRLTALSGGNVTVFGRVTSSSEV